jgi:NitT/TauT family transport system substrate-binding protein
MTLRAPPALMPLMTLAMLAGGLGAAPAQTVSIGIGTQDTTTNTVTTGVVIRELKLLEKYLPKDGNVGVLWLVAED